MTASASRYAPRRPSSTARVVAASPASWAAPSGMPAGGGAAAGAARVLAVIRGGQREPFAVALGGRRDHHRPLPLQPLAGALGLDPGGHRQPLHLGRPVAPALDLRAGELRLQAAVREPAVAADR